MPGKREVCLKGFDGDVKNTYVQLQSENDELARGVDAMGSSFFSQQGTPKTENVNKNLQPEPYLDHQHAAYYINNDYFGA